MAKKTVKKAAKSTGKTGRRIFVAYGKKAFVTSETDAVYIVGTDGSMSTGLRTLLEKERHQAVAEFQAKSNYHRMTEYMHLMHRAASIAEELFQSE